jgi:phospholipid/cholesterol/gamma-HCH transport system ATP-binding protein
MNTTDQILTKPAGDAATRQGDAGGNSEPAVAVKDLHKSFGSQRVLNGVSLSVPQGQTLAILGRSGTGKSVTLRIIIGLEKPDSGSVRIQSEDITGLTIDELSDVRKSMGFLFQHAALYDSLNVEQNVAFPLVHHKTDMSKAEQRERVMELLGDVGMEKHSQKMPADLSGGMQKRVGLARALVLDPKILLLDEPTAGLDPISSAEIDELVLKLQQEHQMASIVVTHDLHSAKTIANRLALLDKGEVVIEGTFDELEKSEIPFVKDFLKHS